jgi:hypothetical protein
MEPNNYYREFKFKMLIICITFNFYCQVNELDKIKDEARSNYEDGKFQIGMQDLEFNGPIFFYLINGVQIDTDTTILGCYYVHEKDTFWIYSHVNKNSKKRQKDITLA